MRGSMSLLGKPVDLAGTALRLCIDIGLHWESEEQALHMDPRVLYDRRCLWYSTYHLDRALCITLGRPFGIIDESTSVQLPTHGQFHVNYILESLEHLKSIASRLTIICSACQNSSRKSDMCYTATSGL